MIKRIINEKYYDIYTITILKFQKFTPSTHESKIEYL